jgi:membrane associated rhomboid family serine protease
MLLPVGDEPNPHHVPAMTVALIVVNVAVYLLITLPMSSRPADPHDPLLAEYVRAIAPLLPPGQSPAELLQQVSAYDLTVFRWGFRPDTFNWLTLLTCMFLHGGFLHLAGNMLYLWIYGNNVEHRLGAPGYLFWYLATGVAATLFHMLFSLRSPIPLVGASGAISGVLGFYLIWFPRNVVKVWVVLFPFYVGLVNIGAIWMLGMYLILDNLLPFLVSPTGGGVARGAHIGGFLAGAAVALVMGRSARRSRT